MFKLHYNVYEKVEELAKLLAQSSEYTELQAAEDAGEKDPELSACVAAFIEKRQQLENETMKDEKDFDLIGALSDDFFGERPQGDRTDHADFDAFFTGGDNRVFRDAGTQTKGYDADFSVVHHEFFVHDFVFFDGFIFFETLEIYFFQFARIQI